MSRPDEPVAGERSRPDVRFGYSRRTFWRALFQEAQVVSGVLKGGQQCRLQDLDKLPDEVLAAIRPMVHPAYEVFVDGDCVYGRHRVEGITLKLFATDETWKWVALGMFNGRQTLEEIGARLAQAMAWERARGFSQALALFLTLANHLICIPRDPLEPLS
jgi:hypothetical protein